MPPLRALSAQRWSLEDFVDQANALLPDYLPADPVSTRVKEEVNARLIRHYTGEGLLDDPDKQGREARYGYRHLLQLLLVRRLLAEGLSAGAISDLARRKSDVELEGLLEGGAEVQITTRLAAPGQSALSFLDSLRRRPGSGPAPAPPAVRAAPVPPRETSWERHTIADGLELHIRSDFRLPDSPKTRHNLLALLEQRLQKRGRR